MNLKLVFRRVVLVVVFNYVYFSSIAQHTVVSGVIRDALTNLPVQFTGVYFKGGNGVNTDSLGRYHIQTDKSFNQIIVSHIGYKSTIKNIVIGKVQTLDIELERDASKLTDVTVSSKNRDRYRNKNNPAVELIKKVIENKSKNKNENYDFTEYEQYEKLQIALSNVSDKVTNNKLLKKYHFIFENRDTTKMDGRVLLPVYMEETLSKNYYRKNPFKNKNIISAQKRVDFGEYIDNAGVKAYLDRLYADIDIYDDNIPLFTNQFLSPIASISPNFYFFYIRDTITDESGQQLVKLYFTPRNTNDLLFRGTMYITLDGNYAVAKLNMFISKNVNINWVRDMHIVLDFEKNPDGRYHLSKSDVIADASITKNKDGGFFGGRTVVFKNFKINSPQPDSLYDGPSQVILGTAENKPDSFWVSNRLDTLTTAESKVYKNMDSLKGMRSFRNTMNVASFLLSGYKTAGPKFEFGPFNAFYSFNPVEGFRLRFGGRTTPKLSSRLYLETYGAYGFKDKQWKYFGSVAYSLNNKSIYKYPLNYIKASIQRETKIPGQELQFVQEDNFLLSFKRGNNDKWLYNNYYRLDYVHEFNNHLSYNLGFKYWRQQPAGAITYIKEVNNVPVNVEKVITSEVSFQMRWAPHEQFYQGKVYRIPIINKYPILTLNYIAGIKGLFNGQYNYQHVNLRMEKRFYMSVLGYSDVVLEGSYIFGQIPYPLMNIHRANQTYAYQLESYNLMNFLEFVSDHYTAIDIDHHFMGLLFNRIPLFKKLKWREVASFKAIFGGVRSENDPTKNPSLFKYPTDVNGVPVTYNLNKQPYIEGSVGIGNIFRFFRVDLVKRFSYLDHPLVSPLGVRVRFKFDF